MLSASYSLSRKTGRAQDAEFALKGVAAGPVREDFITHADFFEISAFSKLS
jgi:hypothetical protein